MRRRALILASICGVAFCAPAAATEQAVPTTIKVRGSSGLVPLVTAAAKRYQIAHPEVRIEIKTGGSSSSLARLTRGTIDVALSSRDRARGEGKLKFIDVERVPLAVAVNHDNPIANITGTVAAGLLAGRIHDWKGLGWKAGNSVRLYWRASPSTTALGCRTAFRVAQRVVGATTLATNRIVRAVVSADPQAVACLSTTSLPVQSKNFKVLRIDGVPLTRKTAETGRYRYTRKRFVVTGAATNAAAVAFVRWLTSPAVQCSLVRKLVVPAVRCL